LFHVSSYATLGRADHLAYRRIYLSLLLFNHSLGRSTDSVDCRVKVVKLLAYAYTRLVQHIATGLLIVMVAAIVHCLPRSSAVRLEWCSLTGVLFPSAMRSASLTPAHARTVLGSARSNTHTFAADRP
jgi:hypothetical protein